MAELNSQAHNQSDFKAYAYLLYLPYQSNTPCLVSFYIVLVNLEGVCFCFINVLLCGYLFANWLTFTKSHSSQWQLRCVFFSRAYLESEVAISEELVQKYSNSALGHVNCTIKELRRLFLVDDLVDSLKVSLFAFHFLTYPEFNIRVKGIKLCFLY